MSRPARNHVIDAARAASIVVVVAFHGLLYQIQLVDGRPVVVPWAAPATFYPFTWVLMVIPLFFVAGGFAHGLLVDRMRREGTAYGSFLANRGRRLVGPVVSFVTVCALIASAAAWAGWLDAASELSRQIAQLLWFITVYLFIVALAPWAVALHDRFGAWVLVAPVAAALAVDAWSFASGDVGVRNLNMVLVWPVVHQFGIAYHRGWWRDGPAWRAWASVAAGVGLIAGLVFGLGYPPTSVGFADLPFANVQPPTTAMVALALAQCGVLGLVERSGVLARVSPRVEGVLGVVNALTVTVYLWHIPVIFVAGGLLLGVAWAWPAAASVALSQASVVVLSLMLVAVVAPGIGRLDLALIPPLGERQDARVAVAAYAVLFVGTLLVWQAGMAVHPARPVSTAGVLAIWVGAALMAYASNARARSVGLRRA